MRLAVIYPGEDGMWVAEVPSLPGCISQGETREDAIRNVREAVELWLEVMREKGLSAPPERFGIEVCVI